MCQRIDAPQLTEAQLTRISACHIPGYQNEKLQTDDLRSKLEGSIIPERRSTAPIPFSAQSLPMQLITAAYLYRARAPMRPSISRRWFPLLVSPVIEPRAMLAGLSNLRQVISRGSSSLPPSRAARHPRPDPSLHYISGETTSRLVLPSENLEDPRVLPSAEVRTDAEIGRPSSYHN